MATEKKMTDLRKMPSERDALVHYKKGRSPVWCEMAFGDASSATLYALAFDTDKVQQITHIKPVRRILNRFAKSCLSVDDQASVKEEMQKDKVLKEARELILQAEPGYSSDKDVDHPMGNEGDSMLWRTKAVRGEGQRKRIRTENAKNVNRLYPHGKNGKKEKRQENEPGDIAASLPLGNGTSGGTPQDAAGYSANQNGRNYAQRLIDQFGEEDDGEEAENNE